MKLVTITITLVLLSIGYGAGWYGGHAAGRDEVHTAMLDTMGGLAMPQFNSKK